MHDLSPCSGSRSEDRDRFYFNFGPIVKQTLNFNQHHRRKVFAEMRAIRLTNLFAPAHIFLFVGYVQKETRNLIGLSTRSADDCQDIGECAIKLFDEIVADDGLFFIPANLAGNKQQAATSVCYNAV